MPCAFMVWRGLWHGCAPRVTCPHPPSPFRRCSTTACLVPWYWYHQGPWRQRPRVCTVPWYCCCSTPGGCQAGPAVRGRVNPRRQCTLRCHAGHFYARHQGQFVSQSVSQRWWLGRYAVLLQCWPSSCTSSRRVVWWSLIVLFFSAPTGLGTQCCCSAGHFMLIMQVSQWWCRGLAKEGACTTPQCPRLLSFSQPYLQES